MSDVGWLAVAGLVVAAAVLVALGIVEHRDRKREPVLKPSTPITGAGRSRYRRPTADPSQPLPSPTSRTTGNVAHLSGPQEISLDVAEALHRDIEAFLSEAGS